MDVGNLIKIPVETSLAPDFYSDFHCLAERCHDSCCIGWQVTFQKKDYLKLKRLNAPEELKTRLGQAIRRYRNDGAAFYAHFQMDKTGRCPLLDQDSLCSLQKTCGESALPHVCANFPRCGVYTTAAYEFSMTPGCEGVLGLLWDRPEGIEFVESPLEKGDVRTYPVDADGSPFLPYFETIRSVCIDLLQNRTFKLKHRMLAIGIALQQLLCIEPSPQTIESWCDQVSALFGEGSKIGLPNGDLRLFLSQNIVVAYKLLPEVWAAELLKNVGAVFSPDGKCSFGLEGYLHRKEVLEEILGNLDCFFENLMVAVALNLRFPQLDSKDELWKSYVNFCSLYSFYRFAAVCGFEALPTKEKLFHTLVMASRSLLHNSMRQAELQDSFFDHGSTSLAHMAILVGE